MFFLRDLGGFCFYVICHQMKSVCRSMYIAR